MAFMDLLRLSSLLAVLSTGRTMIWKGQSPDASGGVYAPQGTPDSPTDGQDLNGADGQSVSVGLQIRPRLDAQRRTVDFSITSFSAGNFTVTINSTGHTATSPADAPTALNTLRDAINAGAEAGNVTAITLDSSGVQTTGTSASTAILRVYGDNDTDFTVNATTTGSGVWRVLADALTAEVRLWGYRQSGVQDGDTAEPYSQGWTLIPDAVYSAATANQVSKYGLTDNFAVPGYSRIYAQVTAATKAGGDGAGVLARVRIYWGLPTREGAT